ncbi:MAG: peptidoglycan DD-metalloendopeptidase family protein [Bacteroidales bacterium]|nr:peptidoglycan DD-metalloendopeptidase family protein [Bacteroidales bacterium]
MKSLILPLIILMNLVLSCTQPTGLTPIRAVIELDIGESEEITLNNGEKVRLTLMEIEVDLDSLRNAIRSVNVKVSVDGEEVCLGSGNYHLPVEVGNIQIDCPVVKNYYTNSNSDRWGLTKDARFRLWPKGSSYMDPGTFVYPVKQKWFASMSQSGNEPPYVDWGEDPASKEIYYHSGHDFGGAEGMDEIVSATDGLVISALGDTLEGYDDFPGDIRTDVVWILTNLGWYIRYSHLDSTDAAIRTGASVRMGQRIGFMGKQGGSGGWVHLHFELKTRETASGNWGTEDAYAYLWESYVNQYDPTVIAVARPHHLLWTGQQTILDGGKSKSYAGDIVSYEWAFSDGTNAEGAIQERSYTMPGEYSEVLKVTDSKGNVDYDFTVVQVYDRDNPDQTIPVVQAAYHPSLDIKPDDPVTFLVRTFNTEVGSEIWDFGDGSPQVSVRSETPDRQNYTEGKFAETVHSFAEPGDYIVKVERLDEAGIRANAHLHVVVND